MFSQAKPTKANFALMAKAAHNIISLALCFCSTKQTNLALASSSRLSSIRLNNGPIFVWKSLWLIGSFYPRPTSALISRRRTILLSQSQRTRLTTQAAAMLEGFSAVIRRDSKLRQSVHEDAKAFNDYASSALELTEPHLSDQGLWTAIRSSRDIDQNKRRRYLYHAYFSGPQDEGQPVVITTLPPMELHDNILARIPSPSGEKVAIVREEVTTDPCNKKKQVVEIWTDSGSALLRRISLPEKEHGKLIFGDVTFGGPSWNADETALAYLAERNAPKTESFFDKPSYEESINGVSNRDPDSVVIRGGTHTLGYGKSERWGEKYARQAPLLDLFLVNVETGRVGKVENCPGSEIGQTSTLGSFVLAQPVFEPTLGETVVYTAFDAGGGPDMPRRLGLIHCQQRPSKLYASPIKNLLERLAATHYQDDSTIKAFSEKSSSEESKPEDVPERERALKDTAEKDGARRREMPSKETAGKDGACFCLTLGSRLASSPQFSPVSRGKARLVFLSSNDGFDTHSGCLDLSCMDWSKGRPIPSSWRTIVPRVWDPNQSPIESGTVLGMKFPGLFLQQLPSRCFLSHNYLLATTQWGSSLCMVRVSLKTGSLIPIQRASSPNSTESDNVLCVHSKHGLVAMTSSPNTIPTVWHVPTSRLIKEEQSIRLQESDMTLLKTVSSPIAASKFSSTPKKPKLEFKTGVRFLMDNQLPLVRRVDIKGVPLQTILLLPDRNSDSGELPPLIVVPHGGPHSVSSTSYVPSYAYLCGYAGYAVALVNYRGSTGFGQGFIESLPGHIGDLDVKDIVAATLQLKESGLVDKSRIGICGGSHGGFLTAHLTGQYPDLFRAAAMRNPVTNLPSMTTATDIPDWVFVEGLGSYDWMKYRPPMSKEEVSTLWEKSPIRYVQNVKTPTLVALGMQDLRVPPSQGLEWYHTLRSSRVPTKLLLYEDNDHAILGTAAEADHWINVKRWFDEHL